MPVLPSGFETKAHQAASEHVTAISYSFKNCSQIHNFY